MPDPPSTSLTLLARAIRRDESAWSRLVHLYQPLVAYWCRAQGVPSADIDDVAQEVLVAVAKDLSKFQRERHGGFRAWVRGIARHKALDRLRHRPDPEALGGTAAHQQIQQLADLASSDELDDRQEEAWLYRRALELVRVEFTEKTWQAFWRVAVDDRPTDMVAAELEMTPVAVRIAKSRVLARLREEVGDLLE